MRQFGEQRRHVRFEESCQAMSPSSWFGQGSSVGGTHPSPVAYHGLYALTVRWQSPAPRGDLHRKSLATCIPEPSLLPKDPRHWSRDDVAVWLIHVMAQHSLPAVSADRFLMNGKALCLMTMEMFVQRVPLGGKLLYKDFQLRLSSVLYN